MNSRVHEVIDALCAMADQIDPHATDSGESDDPFAHYLTMLALQLNMVSDSDPASIAGRLLLLDAKRSYPI